DGSRRPCRVRGAAASARPGLPHLPVWIAGGGDGPSAFRHRYRYRGSGAGISRSDGADRGRARRGADALHDRDCGFHAGPGEVPAGCDPQDPAMRKTTSLRADFAAAVARLEEALALPKDGIVRDSAIQRFEISFELCWK